MSRTFQDSGFLLWEVFPSGGRFGQSDDPHLIFHNLTRRELRPRAVQLPGDEADAERLIVEVDDAALLALLQRATEIS